MKLYKFLFIFLFVVFMNPKIKEAKIYDVSNIRIDLQTGNFIMTDFGYSETGHVPNFYSILISSRDPSEGLEKSGWKVEQFYKVAE